MNINSSNTGSTSVTSCGTYIWDGVSYIISGTYTNVYTNVAGCDSTHTLNLNINNIDSINFTVTSCDSYIWDGDTLISSGSYINIYNNVLGCDSIVVINLTINNSTSTNVSVNSCDDYIWPIDGQTYNVSGTYTSTSINSAGCQHIDLSLIHI